MLRAGFRALDPAAATYPAASCYSSGGPLRLIPSQPRSPRPEDRLSAECPKVTERPGPVHACMHSRALATREEDTSVAGLGPGRGPQHLNWYGSGSPGVSPPLVVRHHSARLLSSHSPVVPSLFFVTPQVIFQTSTVTTAHQPHLFFLICIILSSMMSHSILVAAVCLSITWLAACVCG